MVRRVVVHPDRPDIFVKQGKRGGRSIKSETKLALCLDQTHFSCGRYLATDMTSWRQASSTCSASRADVCIHPTRQQHRKKTQRKSLELQLKSIRTRKLKPAWVRFADLRSVRVLHSIQFKAPSNICRTDFLRYHSHVI